jgi:ABC-type methionine transport system ATPase subunit
MQVSHRIVLHFPPAVSDQPVIYRLAKDYDLVFNILRASVSPQEEGLMVLELSGEEAAYQRGAGYLEQQGIKLQPEER